METRHARARVHAHFECLLWATVLQSEQLLSNQLCVVSRLSPCVSVMAERSSVKKRQSLVPLTKRRPPSSSKTETKSVSELTTKQTPDFFAQEQQYKLMNAELEAKTAELVKEAEQLMREQSEVLSTPLSTLLLTDFQDEEDSRTMTSQQCSVQESLKSRNRVTSSSSSSSQHVHARRPGKESECQSHTDMRGAAAQDFLSNTIRNIDEKMNEHVLDDHDTVASVVSEAQTRVFKAKIRILQEEVDQLSCEYYKKEDENAKLRAKVKDLEEDRSRLQKTTNVQQTQMEKHKALAEESAKKSEALQTQVSALNKEIENLNRSSKQAASAHSSMEVRLNRALEEVERTKTQLSKITHINKDKMKEENQSKENVLAENRMLKKHKAELIMGFKKQLKLIDLLKRQKMHFEAAKMLSFTEDEFMKALDWSNS
uniref:testis-expressed protein 9-like isoform X3 n=1 Tax=Solea senegalensis TaxID=28829 RepID=UPI001CD88306|nr:testis-expressed protein 9-like isoform X3 [Solea senegalensis]